jgi:hypothetical protein
VCRVKRSSRPFFGHETKLDWAANLAVASREQSAVLKRSLPAMQDEQRKLIDS